MVCLGVGEKEPCGGVQGEFVMGKWVRAGLECSLFIFCFCFVFKEGSDATIFVF